MAPELPDDDIPPWLVGVGVTVVLLVLVALFGMGVYTMMGDAPAH